MKLTRFLVSLVALAAFATSASAQGAVSLNWDSCTGPINKAVNTVDDGNGMAANNLFASVTGHSLPHKAYQVFIAFGAGSAGPLRDAWRFDGPDGCQGPGYINYNHLSTNKACPAFQSNLQSLQITDYSFYPATGKARAVLANSYPAGTPAMAVPTTDPAVRYHLARFQFNHVYSVAGATTPGADCGGLEVPVCAHFISKAWLDMDGIEHEWNMSGEYVTANDPTNASGCPGATPAKSTSWGYIKDQYKR